MAAYSRVKSFGLAQHRLALPENDPSRVVLPNQKREKKKRRSIGERVSNFLHRGGSTSKGPPSPLVQAKREALIHHQYVAEETARKSPAISNGRRTPGSSGSPALHLRVLGSHSLTGSQSSLDNILQTDYGYKRDGTPVMNRKKLTTGESNLIKLTLNSNGKGSEHHVTLTKSKAGLGIHLSIGPPPVSVTLVEPGSVAMTAGVKEGDIIMEVNGKDCRSMEALQLSELLELKSLIQHVPSASSMDSARKIFKAGTNVGESDSYSSESDSEREDDERETNLNKKKQKRITKGVWNRIKAEGLIDSESESGGSFVNLPITAIESSSSDEEEWLAGKDYSKHSTKIEIDEKEWRKMRQQQELIYSNAPSFMISSKNNTVSSVSNSKNKNDEKSLPTKSQSKSPILAVKRKLFNKWLFASKSPSPHKGNSREGTPSPANMILQSSEYHSTSSDDGEYDRPPILGQVSVEGKKAPSRPTRRSRSMYVVPSKSSKETKPPPVVVPAPVVGMKKRRSSTDITAVQRNSPLLGVGAGRDRRNIGRARNVRKPTTRQVSSPSSTQQTNTANPSITVTPEPVKKVISDPGHDKTKTKQDNPKLRRRSSASAVVSSAALVEAAVRKRNSITEMVTDDHHLHNGEKRGGEKRNDHDNILSRRRKQAVTNPYAIMPEGASAQLVANAAATKARLIKKEKSVKTHHKPPVPLPQQNMQSNRGGRQQVTEKRATTRHHQPSQPPSHPLHKSRSFHSGEEIRKEPMWVGLAKNKHEKNLQQYVSGDTIHKKGGGDAVHQIKSYGDYLQTLKDKSSGKVTETKID